MATKENGRVIFRDRDSKVIREIELKTRNESPSAGYQEDAKITTERVVITRSTLHLDAEYVEQDLDLYDLNGTRLAQITNAPRYWISPKGRLIVVPGETNSAPSTPTGDVRIYDGLGELIAQSSVFDFVGDAGVAFSRTERILAYMLQGMRESASGPESSGIAIFNARGELLGKYVTSDWAPSGSVLRSGHVTYGAIIFQERAGRLLIQGLKAGSLEPWLYCLDFHANLLWKKHVPLNTSFTAVLADPDGDDFSILELGDKTVVTTYDSQTGNQTKLKEAQISLPPGILPKVSRSGKMIAISGAGLKSDGVRKNAILIDDDARINWADEGDEQNVRLVFDNEGHLTLRKHNEIRVLGVPREN